MRLLHTSDWHLGQTLHQFERSHEHVAFLAWLLDTLEAEAVDALLIAGDVFDNANPSSQSQTQLYRFLTEARRRVPWLNIVIIAGNHDSPGRLEAPLPFLALLDAHVVGQTVRTAGEVDLERLLVPLKGQGGEVEAWCMAMPFLRPADVPRVEGAEDAYLAGIELLHRQVLDVALARRRPGQALVAMGHCHMTGGEVSVESERRIVVGGAEALSASLFDPAIAYVALGHLHLAQCIGKDPTRRYCGSPLPLSFSEIHYPHQVVLVDLDGESVASVRDVRVPRAVELLRVPARPASVDEALAALEALALPDGPEAGWPYLQVRVRLDQPEPGLRARVEAALAGKPVRLARIETTYARRADEAAAPALSVDELEALGPADFFQRLYAHRFGDAPPAELMGAFNDLLASPTSPAGAAPDA
ncbi:MAG: exonuclease SbcCD subunit D C-terminal domain-containing protein [Zoogloea sp.]|nr:exonuclease SbcCD subunit D C-terminal domain-containing protein [Zoogloea sp.]